MSGHFCPVNTYSPTEKNDNRRQRSNTALGWLFSLTCVGHSGTWPKPETDQNYESSKLVSGICRVGLRRVLQCMLIYE